MTRMEEIEALNKKHLENPQEGDVWREMHVPYFKVLAVTKFGIVVFEKTYSVDENHYKFDETKPTLLTREEFKDRITYSTMPDKFVANVRPYPQDKN